MREDGTIVTAKVALRQVTKMLRQRQNECGDLAGVPQLMAGSQSTYTILRLHFHTVKGRSLCQQWYCREKLPSFSLRTPQPYHDLVIPAWLITWFHPVTTCNSEPVSTYFKNNGVERDMKAPPLARDTIRHLLRNDCLPGELLHRQRYNDRDLLQCQSQVPWTIEPGHPEVVFCGHNVFRNAIRNNRIIFQILTILLNTHTHTNTL